MSPNPAHKFRSRRLANQDQQVVTNGSHGDEAEVEALKIVPAFPEMKQESADSRVRHQDQHDHDPRQAHLVLAHFALFPHVK